MSANEVAMLGPEGLMIAETVIKGGVIFLLLGFAFIVDMLWKH